jgi:hypothetical protein
MHALLCYAVRKAQYSLHFSQQSSISTSNPHLPGVPKFQTGGNIIDGGRLVFWVPELNPIQRAVVVMMMMMMMMVLVFVAILLP